MLMFKITPTASLGLTIYVQCYLWIYKRRHCAWEALCTDLPALYVRLELLESLQLLHLSLRLVDVGAHLLHGLQSFLHGRVIRKLLRRSFQQLLQWTHKCLSASKSTFRRTSRPSAQSQRDEVKTAERKNKREEERTHTCAHTGTNIKRQAMQRNKQTRIHTNRLIERTTEKGTD